jgi:ankyrin repeat protein
MHSILRIILSGALLMVLSACGQSGPSAEEARGKLAQMNIEYSEDSFLERVIEGDLLAVQLFLFAGMDVEVKDSNGWTALNAAAANGHLPVVQALLEKGAEVNVKINKGLTALMFAAIDGHLRVVQALLEKRVDVNARDNDGWTALMFAGGKGHLLVVQALLDKGGDFNAKTNKGWTALMVAADKGHLSVLQALLAKGGDFNARDDDDCTALIKASINGHLRMVQALLDKGAEVNAKDNKGGTALQWAASKGHIEVVQALLEKRAEVNARDNDGWTPLMWAAGKGHLLVVQTLLDKGAEVNAKNNQGGTAVMFAELEGHSEVVNLLRRGMGKAAIYHEADAVRATLARYLMALVDGDTDKLLRCYTGSPEYLHLIRSAGEVPSAMKTFRDRFVETYGAAAWKVFREQSRAKAQVNWNLEATAEEDMALVARTLQSIDITITGDEASLRGEAVIDPTRLKRVGSSWLFDAANVVPPGVKREVWVDQIHQKSALLRRITRSIGQTGVTPDHIVDQLKEGVEKLM